MTDGSNGMEFAGTVRLDGPRGPVEVVGAGDVLSIRLRSPWQLSAVATLGRALRRPVRREAAERVTGRVAGDLGFDVVVGSRRIATWRGGRLRLPAGVGRWRPDLPGLLGLSSPLA